MGSFVEDIRTRINRNGLRINISSHKLAFIAARVRKSPNAIITRMDMMEGYGQHNIHTIRPLSLGVPATAAVEQGGPLLLFMDIYGDYRRPQNI